MADTDTSFKVLLHVLYLIGLGLTGAVNLGHFRIWVFPDVRRPQYFSGCSPGDFWDGRG